MMKLKAAGIVLAGLLVTGCQTTVKGPHTHTDVAPCDIGADVINHVHFAYDKHHLNKKAMDRVAAQAAWLKAHPDTYAVLEGHTDTRGSREYNLALGERRGVAVKRELMVKHGIDGQRLHVVSFGKDKPVAKSHSENRVVVTRVE